jgi:hypothetical protein
MSDISDANRIWRGRLKSERDKRRRAQRRLESVKRENLELKAIVAAVKHYADGPHVMCGTPQGYPEECIEDCPACAIKRALQPPKTT